MAPARLALRLAAYSHMFDLVLFAPRRLPMLPHSVPPEQIARDLGFEKGVLGERGQQATTGTPFVFTRFMMLCTEEAKELSGSLSMAGR